MDDDPVDVIEIVPASGNSFWGFKALSDFRGFGPLLKLSETLNFCQQLLKAPEAPKALEDFEIAPQALKALKWARKIS